jgi:hypothetical protein
VGLDCGSINFQDGRAVTKKQRLQTLDRGSEHTLFHGTLEAVWNGSGRSTGVNWVLGWISKTGLRFDFDFDIGLY